MAWCENENCRNFRQNILRKADVEFCDDTKKVLCHGCYSSVHPTWTPPQEYVDLTDSVPRVARPQPEVGFAIQLTHEGGLKAQVNYGGLSFAVMAPMDEIKKLMRG